MIGDLIAIQRGAALAADMAAGLRAGQAFAAAYSRAKRSAGVADFDDLIHWTRRLLDNAGHGRVGALQARPAHRPYPGRRGAGHQPATNGRSSRRWPSEFFSGAERGRATAAGRCSWSATSSRRSSASRAPIRREFETMRADGSASNAAALREAEDEADAGERLALEFRDLSIDASFRSAPAILDAVDAVIDEVGYRGDGPARRSPTATAPISTAGRAWSSCGSRSPSTTAEDDDEGEEGWLGERDRLYADRAGQPGQALARRSAGARHDPAAAGARRHPDPGPQPRRAGLADRRAAVRRQGAGRGHRPAASVKAVRGPRPARRGRLRGPAARRPQPRQSAGLAADRLDPGAIVRPCARPRQEAAVAGAARAVRRAAASAAAHEALGSLLAMADFTTPARFLETILSGPLDGRRKLYAPPRPGGARPDRRIAVERAWNSSATKSPSLDRFLAWFARGDVEIKRDPSAPAQCGAGDDRARRQGPGSAGRDPRRRHRRSGAAWRREPDARLSGARRRQGAAAAPAQG